MEIWMEGWFTSTNLQMSDLVSFLSMDETGKED